MQRHAAVMGAAGALGATMMKTLRGRGWRVIGIDSRQVVDGLRRPPVGMEAGVLWNVLVPTNGANPAEQKKHVIGEMKLMGFGNEEGQKKLDAVLCFNGGFAMGNASCDDLLISVEKMYGSIVVPSFLGASLASSFLRPGSLFLLTGALAGGNVPTPRILAYGSAKAAVHHLVRSLSHETSGLPDGTKVIGVAPDILDTEMNRTSMPNSPRDNWTPLGELSNKVCDWAESPQSCTSGTIYKVITTPAGTTYDAL